ncbi:hypothetical protein SprV_0501940000 [Sparganum proliferum]
MDLFAAATNENFGMVIKTENTVVMHEPPPDAAYIASQINVHSSQLQDVDNSTYLGSNLPTTPKSAMKWFAGFPRAAKPSIACRTPTTILFLFHCLNTRTTAPLPTTTAHNSDTPTNPNFPTVNASDVDSIHACPICDRTFTSHIGLVGHLRILRTETDELMPGAPTYTRRIRLHCPQCPHTISHRMSLFGHMRIHESGTDSSLNTRSTSCTSTMPSSTRIPPPGIPTNITSTTLSTLCTSTMSISTQHVYLAQHVHHQQLHHYHHLRNRH